MERQPCYFTISHAWLQVLSLTDWLEAGMSVPGLNKDLLKELGGYYNHHYSSLHLLQHLTPQVDSLTRLL